MITRMLSGLWHRDVQALRRINHAPTSVIWRRVRPRPSAEPVQAELARWSGTLDTPRGPLRYEADNHYIVTYGPDDRAPVRRKLFESTYRRREDGSFEKRTDHVTRYFTLSYPVIVETLEGDELAQPGDWIMQGAAGELWPISADDAQAKYEPA